MSKRHEQATASALAFVGCFQAALAGGAPWGYAAYGGAHHGPLPARLRALSASASIAYFAGATLVWRGTGSPRARRRAFTALSVFMAVGTLLNGASRSPVERALWTPLTAATAISSGLARSQS